MILNLKQHQVDERIKDKETSTKINIDWKLLLNAQKMMS